MVRIEGEITPETTVTNCKDAVDLQVKDVLPPELLNPPPVGEVSISPRPMSIRLNLQQRIRELEEALLEERRARETAEKLIDRLETKLGEFAG